MINIKKWVGLVGVMCVCGGVFAEVSGDTSDTQITPESSSVKAPEFQPNRAKNQLDEIVVGEEYSNTHQESRWVKNEKKTYQQSNLDFSWLETFFRGLTNLGQHIGIFGKTVAIGFLVLLVWWLYRTRQTWLSWVVRFAPLDKRTLTPTHVPHVSYDEWENLPKADELVDYVQKLLARGEYLSALSVLYRGTLRQVDDEYALAIDRHHTEDQCVRLLLKSNASAHESDYLKRLVNLWRACAYGHELPTNPQTHIAQISELIQSWSALYGQSTHAKGEQR